MSADVKGYASWKVGTSPWEYDLDCGDSQGLPRVMPSSALLG
jgi:hypothetical protein